MSQFPDQQTLIKYIGKVSLFSHADQSILESLAAKTKIVLHKAGENIIQKGDQGHTMYIIFSGKLKVHDGEHVVATLNEGDFFGEFSLLDGEPRSMSVSALNTSVLGSIERDDFYQVLNSFPAITRDIIAALNRRVRKQNEVLINEFRTREEQLKELVQIRTQELVEKNKQLEETLEDLKRSQMQLIQSEKLASLGKLTAGIAHEIQNPLNFVNNFSILSMDLIKEFNDATSDEERVEIISQLLNNIERIRHNGSRADLIVKNMLEHSRTGKGEKQMTDINQMCEEYMKLAHHSILQKYPDFKCIIYQSKDENLKPVEIIPQEMSKAVWNILNNAFYAVRERQKKEGEQSNYSPWVQLGTKLENDIIHISIRDNGSGILDEHKDKVFNPFFTTKPTGEGTGLGLSISYDIVKAHEGDILFSSVPNQGTEFIIMLKSN